MSVYLFLCHMRNHLGFSGLKILLLNVLILEGQWEKQIPVPWGLMDQEPSWDNRIPPTPWRSLQQTRGAFYMAVQGPQEYKIESFQAYAAF